MKTNKIKRIVTGILTIVIICAFTIVSGAVAHSGDVTGDGFVTSIDVLYMLEHSVGIITLRGDKFTSADMNGDNLVNSTDSLIAIQKAVSSNNAVAR